MKKHGGGGEQKKRKLNTEGRVKRVLERERDEKEIQMMIEMM
jgi:hypothetical protein